MSKITTGFDWTNVKMIVGFDHTSFTVANVDRAVRFWTQTLGFEASDVVVRDGAWPQKVTGIADAKLKIAHLHGYGMHIEFIEYLCGQCDNASPSPNAIGAGHVAFEVDNVEKVCEELAANGAQLQGELDDVVVESVLRGRAVYLRDPNGIIIELWEPLKT